MNVEQLEKYLREYKYYSDSLITLKAIRNQCNGTLMVTGRTQKGAGYTTPDGFNEVTIHLTKQESDEVADIQIAILEKRVRDLGEKIGIDEVKS